MAIKGNLEDLPFIDVIQLLHVARRSGTLSVSSEAGKASIVCREGDIIGATHPSDDVNLGTILKSSGLISSSQLDEAITLMDNAGARRMPLMATLINLGYLRKTEGWKCLNELIHKTMAEIISWKKGTFHFEVDKIEIDDDFRHVPDILDDGAGVDIKGALMEALRIFDERNREQQEREKKEQRKKETERKKEERMLQALEDDFEVPIKEEPEDTVSIRLERFKEAVFLCTDGFIKHSVKTLCKKDRIFSYISGVEKDIVKEIDQCYIEGMDTVFVADLSGTELGGLGPKKRLSIVNRIKSYRPELPVIVMSNSISAKSYTQAYNLGARTLIPIPKRSHSDIKDAKEAYVRQMKQFFKVLITAIHSVFREAYQLQRTAQESRMQIASLKRRIQEIQDRKTSPDVSLVVLQYVAEFLERGIIFLVRKNDLLGLGSFGVDSKGDTISATAMRLKIPLSESSIFRHVVQTGMVFKGASGDTLLKEYVFDRIGSPLSNDVLLLPLKTENKTRAIVYGDFGRREAESLKIDVFEILASQAGMAIEIALQRTRLSRQGTPDYL